MKTAAIVSAALLAAAGGLPQAASAQPAGGPSVDVRDAAARMVVIPEARGDVEVRIVGGDPRLPPLQVRREGARIVVEGGLQRRITGCSESDFGWNGDRKRWGQSVTVRDVGRITLRDLPVITVRTPLDAGVGAGGAVWGEVGPSEALHLAHAGCGDWTVASVRRALDLSSQGSGDTRARTVGALNSATQGSGDLMLDAVEGPTAISIAGSGDVTIRRVTGPVSSQIAGSGDVRIADGQAANVAVRIAGSGDFTFNGRAGALSAQVAGSGDVHVAHVDGPVAKSVQGSGEVTVGR